MENATTPKTFDFIINRRAGTVLHDTEAVVEKNLREIFGAAVGAISFVEGKDLTATVRQWAADNKGNNDRDLIVGGGDGSILSAAVELLNSDITLGLLPLGTNNLVARELGFSADYKKAAAQCYGSTTQKIDICTVNGKHFLYGMVMGKSVDFFKARENIRNGKYLSALKDAFNFAAGILIGRKTTLTLDGAAVKGRIFAVTNNATSPRANEGKNLRLSQWKDVVGNSFSKKDLDSGEAAFYGTSGGLMKAPTVIWSILKGTWDKRKDVTIRKAPQMLIDRTAGPGSKSKNTPVVLDGEIMQMQFPLDIRVLPKALTVLRPN